MSTPTPRLKTSLPFQLSSADRVWQGDRAKRMFAASIKWLLLGLVLLLLADVIFHLSPWARIGGTLIWIASLVGVFLGMFWIALVAHSPLERVARLLESRSSSLGSKLINIIQLQKQIDDPALPEPTRILAQRAVEESDAALVEFKLGELARTPFTKNQKIGAWIPLAVFALMGIAFFQVFSREALRFVDPFGDHPPFAFTTLKIITPDKDGEKVIYRQSATIEVRWSGHDPSDLYLTTWDPANRETLRTLPMIRKTEDSFVQQLENITSNLVVIAHNKDRRALSTERTLEVLLTPQIEESRVAISLPTYTGVKPSEMPYRYKTLQALEGSELTFSIQSNRPLSGGEIKVTSTEGEISTVAMSPLSDRPEVVVGSIQARGSARLDFSVRDITGIPSDAVLSGGLTVTKDMPPSIQIAEPYNDSFIIISHRLKALFEATDDYGVKTLRIHRALNEQYSPPRVYDFTEEPRRQTQECLFDLPTLGIAPGDVISFFAEVIDNAPQPQLTRSETRHLLVISQEQYNEQMRLQTDLSMIEEKFQDLVDDFDPLVEEQERIANELEELEKNGGDPASAEQQKQLEQLLNEQSKLNQDIENHAGEMEKFTGEAPLYDLEKDLQDRLKERATELRESAQANEQATAAAREQSATNPNAANQASQQSAREQLEKMRGSQQQQKESISQPLEDLAQMHELMKDFNHYQQLYEEQKNVAQQAAPYGSGRPLDNNDRLALEELAAREESIRQQLSELSEKLKKDAAAAEEKFPKAAQSGKDLAEQIDQNQLPEQAENSSAAMLKGKGQESAERSEKLRRDMESIMNQCQACQNGGQGMGEEIDQYLTMQGMQAGESFQQMMESRLFGQQQGQGQGMGGKGSGAGGSHANGMSYSPHRSVLGGDSQLGQPRGGQGQSHKFGDGKPGATEATTNDTKTSDLPEIKTSTRDSKAVTPEILAEQYRGIVEEYFRALTRPRSVPARSEKPISGEK